MLGTLEKLDQALVDALSQQGAGRDPYIPFAAAMAEAVAASPASSGEPIELRFFSGDVSPEHRRAVAWALMRFLGSAGRLPDRPRHLRPKALAFIKQQLEHELRPHHIDFTQPSHELEGTLSQVVPNIEREVSEALPFAGLDSVSEYKERLFRAINKRSNSGLLLTFAPRSVLFSPLEQCLAAVEAFRHAEESDILDEYERAREACTEAHQSLAAVQTYYASHLFAAVPVALHQSLESYIAALEFTQPAALHLEAVSKKYPLHQPGADLELRLALSHAGGGSAFDIRVNLATTNELLLHQHETSVSNLTTGDSRQLRFNAQVREPADLALLQATVEWMNFSRETDSVTFDLELEAQSAAIDWDALASSMPYALEVATGARFVGRTALLKRMVGQVVSPSPRSLYLWGQKRVGKTSVVRAVADIVQAADPSFAVVYLETIRERTAEQSTDAICRRLIAQLQTSDDRFRSLPVPDYIGSLSPLSEYLDQLIAVAPDKKFLIVLDEFDELPVELYKGRSIADTFFQTLGKGIAGKSQVSVILVGGERMPAIIQAQGMRLNMYRPERIDHFERTGEFDDLVRHPGAPLEFSGTAVDNLWEYCSGNPYFLNEICSRLAEIMLERRDAYVTDEEVEQAIEHTLAAIDSNSFAHYWDDGFVDVEEQETRRTRSERIGFLLAVGESLLQGASTVSADDLAERGGKFGLSEMDVDRLLRDFHNRQILVVDEEGVRFRVKLFGEWLRGRGLLQLSSLLWDELGNRERIKDSRAAYLEDEEIDEVLATWGTYQGVRITRQRVRQWLSQFGTAEDQRLMFKLLQRVAFYGEDRIRDRLARVHTMTLANVTRELGSAREHRRDIVVSYLGSVGRSAPSFARTYCQTNSIWKDHCVPPAEVSRLLDEIPRVVSVVFVDDFIGTGRTARRQFDDFFGREVGLQKKLLERDIRVFYVVVAATEDGIVHVRRSLESGTVPITVYAGDQLGEDSKAFSGSSSIWLNAGERELAEEIARSVGDRLEARAPLGFGNTQGLVVFEGNCPNTSLPILHKRRKVLKEMFYPLFPRSS